MNEENQKKLSELAKRAWTDETLRNNLISDPAPVLQANGIEIPEGHSVEVVANKESITFNFVRQKSETAEELSDAALAAVAGGTPKASTSTSSTKPVQYLTYTMTEVFISSVQ